MKTLISVALLLAASAAHANPSVSVKNLAFTGTGCGEADSVRLDMAATGQMMFRFFNFEARTTPELDIVNQHCDLEYTLEIPAGFKVKKSKFYVDGTGRISPKGHGDIAVRYTVEGESKAAAVTTLEQNGFTSFKAYDWIDDVAGASACPRTVDVSVQAEVFAERGNGETQQTRVSLRNGVAESQVGLVCEVELEPCH